MILADRILEGFNAEIKLERDDEGNLRITVEDSENHSLEWIKAVDTGHEALEVYWHPFCYGLEL